MPNWKSYESTVRLLSSILAAHPDLKLNYSEISRCFSQGATPGAVQTIMRFHNTDAKRIKMALDRGDDPGDLVIPSGMRYISSYYGEDCTKAALDHRFRPIKRMAVAMRAAGLAIADKYEQGATAGSLMKQMSRFKQDPNWLGNEANIPNSGDGDAGTPAKKGGAKKGAAPARKRAPAKSKAKTAKAKSEEEVDDEEGDAMQEDDDEAVHSPDAVPTTPKKRKNNKVLTGRVTKSGGGRKTKTSVPSYADESDDLALDSDSDNSTYNNSGGDEPADMRKKKFRAKTNGNGNGAGGDESMFNNGRNGSVSQTSQAGGDGDVYYDAPEGEEQDYQQC